LLPLYLKYLSPDARHILELFTLTEQLQIVKEVRQREIAEPLVFDKKPYNLSTRVVHICNVTQKKKKRGLASIPEVALPLRKIVHTVARHIHKIFNNLINMICCRFSDGCYALNGPVPQRV